MPDTVRRGSRFLVAAAVTLVSALLWASPATGAPDLDPLVTGTVEGTAGLDSTACDANELLQFWRGTFTPTVGRRTGTLDVEVCVTLSLGFPFSGTFTLTTTGGSVTGTTQGEVIDLFRGDDLVLVVDDGTGRLRDVTGTLVVDFDFAFQVTGPFTATLTGDVTRT
jgi:hypothetical protein